MNDHGDGLAGCHAEGLEDAEVVDAVAGVEDDRVEDAEPGDHDEHQRDHPDPCVHGHDHAGGVGRGGAGEGADAGLVERAVQRVRVRRRIGPYVVPTWQRLCPEPEFGEGGGRGAQDHALALGEEGLADDPYGGPFGRSR
ncbi:hypothetical protein PV726_05860 [Streptomyces europaeiscabiei]|uniref:hypothetical protein n=1 Tax=Streptomyces europaeiscabiei TaxID=146819 RepID=UPI0029B325E4|nr:hypothetical protein [Streptomyces europaeiscabiei]MDX3689870.1 hypothetical protein [Streptomyces europaeiscabiei]